MGAETTPLRAVLMFTICAFSSARDPANTLRGALGCADPEIVEKGRATRGLLEGHALRVHPFDCLHLLGHLALALLPFGANLGIFQTNKAAGRIQDLKRDRGIAGEVRA